VDALAAEQELLNHTIAVQDQERQLIAYEIHDGLLQYVAGALLQLEALQARARPDSLADDLDRVTTILRRAVNEGRQLINGIRTPVLDGFGVVAALESLIEEEERAHVSIEFVKSDEIGRMDSKIEEAVYRICQEALTNIAKHSQAKKVRIELRRQDDKLYLEIRDWGVGFIPATRPSGSVHGLRGMMERARIAGGRGTVESAPGSGTKIVVELPYIAKMYSLVV
jgi:signal transduction histidine kinase